MNNKGFTMVELIVSFMLTSIIVIILVQIIINLKEIYEYSDVKTELLTKQATISNRINEQLLNKQLSNIEECDDIVNYCLNFMFTDGSMTKLIVDTSDQTITIGNDKIKLVDDSYFGKIDASITPLANVAENKNDSILKIQVDIEHDYFEDQNFGLYLVYQYDYQKMNLSYLNFG